MFVTHEHVFVILSCAGGLKRHTKEKQERLLTLVSCILDTTSSSSASPTAPDLRRRPSLAQAISALFYPPKPPPEELSQLREDKRIQTQVSGGCMLAWLYAVMFGN